MEMRRDEVLETRRLEPYLRQHLPEASGEMSVRQFGGGHANLTYLVRFGEAEYVVRRPPLGPVAPGSHDMKREHRVLSVLWQEFPLAPRSYVLCEDPSIIGAPFHVLERKKGFAVRAKLPEFYTPALGRRIGEMMVDTLVALHRVDFAKLGLDGLGKPQGFAQRQVEGWTKRWHAAKDRDLEQMERMSSWLAAKVPEPVRVALLHNDFKLDNMLLDPADPARPVAVLDWDMATLGDPLMDLGQLLTYWSQADDPPEWREGAMMPSSAEGFPGRAEVTRRYTEAMGLKPGAVAWYEAFGVFKLAVVLQQIYIRYVRGQTQDARFAGFDRRVAALAARAVATAGL
jgi:aminoglycoside phosphotransferase (APT) family kinase protein